MLTHMVLFRNKEGPVWYTVHTFCHTIYYNLSIWGFPKMGAPLVIIHFSLGFFNEINRPAIGCYWGTSIYGNPHIYVVYQSC